MWKKVTTNKFILINIFIFQSQMSKIVVTKVSWIKSKPLLMATFAHGTVIKMTDNTDYTTPDVSLTVMDEAATKVEAAYSDRKNPNGGQAELTKAVDDLDSKLHTQGKYVSKTANGDEAMMQRGGWQTIKVTHAKAAALDPSLVAPKLVATIGGKLKSTSAKVPGAKEYITVLVLNGVFNVTISSNGQIIVPVGTNAHIISSSKMTVNFEGMPAKGDVLVAVVTRNAAGYSNFSPVSSAETIS